MSPQLKESYKQGKISGFPLFSFLYLFFKPSPQKHTMISHKGIFLNAKFKSSVQRMVPIRL